MKIILSGYGKMGREVEKTAIARGHQIAAVIDRPEDWDSLDSSRALGCTVIDFSIPSAAVNNIRRCFDLHIPVVVGTTGWHEQAGLVRSWAETERQAIFVGSNFSLGINLMFGTLKVLAALLNKAPGYEISIEETHHVHKLDSPSGTAIKLAEIILSELERKECWVNRPAGSSGELAVISHREGEIPGIHRITCESAADKLVICHEAKDRTGFAAGAVTAAEWMTGRTGYFEMKDMLHQG